MVYLQTTDVHRAGPSVGIGSDLLSGKAGKLTKPTLGFKSKKTAYASIKGFELMNAFRKMKAVILPPDFKLA